jgi:hypothetical protein
MEIRMSKRSAHSFIVVALGVSITGLAAARSPAPLVERQHAATHATQSSSGYRDVHARFGDVGQLAPRVMKAAGGYRDMALRFAGVTKESGEMASKAKPRLQ